METDLVQDSVDMNFQIYICSLCDLKFANQTDLDLHNQLHAGTSGFACPLCKAILPDMQQLQLHDLRHSLAEAEEDVDNLSNIFSQTSAASCITCGEGFSTEEELMMHCALHADNLNERQIIAIDIEKLNNFAKPMVQINKRNMKVAKKSFNRPSRPFSRRPPTTFDREKSPEVLSENYSQLQTQEKHYSMIEEDLYYLTIENEEESETQPVEPKQRRRGSPRGPISATRKRCDQCKRIFSNSYSLKRHKSILHLNKRPYVCIYCRKTFIQISMLTRHTLRNHMPKEEIYTCEYCTEEFIEQDLLHQHYAEVHDMKITCEACFKFFTTREDYNRHMIEHVTTFGFDCCRCKRRYKNEWELQRHRCIQERPKQYLCKVCGKLFSRKYHLTRHFRVHSHLEGCQTNYGVKVECDSDGLVEKPIQLKPRKKMIHTSTRLEAATYYKSGRRTMKGKKMNFQCYICNIKWPNLRRYKQHFIMAHKNVRFNSCHICGKYFSTAYKVRRHLICHDIFPSTDATLLPKSELEFDENDLVDNSTLYDVENEFNIVEDKRSDYTCYICQQKCANARRFRLHFKVQHKKVEVNSCHICSKQFPSTSKVRRHLISHKVKVKLEDKSDDGQNRHSEVILYDDPAIALLENDNTYGRGVRKTFLCYVCKKNCYNYKRYKEHFLAEHKNVRLNACHICHKQFATTSKVKRHLQSHTHERNFRCHACSKRFTQLAHLKRHRLLMHTVKSTRLSKCTYCPKLYADKASFDKHVLMHQLAERSNFKCSVCQEKFVEERLLDEHILAFHDFFKKYQCGVCRRRFHRQSYLNRHMMIHTGMRKWKCFKCNKRFGTKSDLTRHLLTHTELKPFPCFFCEKCFTRNSNRQKHISLYHDIRDVNVFKEEENDIKPFQDLTDKQKLILMTFT